MQGFFELSDQKNISEKQVDLIRRHLNMVFIHEIDPSFPAEQQEALNTAHIVNNVIADTKRPPGDGLIRC